MDTHDKASVHLGMARTYMQLDDPEAARRQVLLALEIAPRFGGERVDGAVLVQLESIRRIESVLPAIASALSIRGDGRISLM